MQKSKNKTKKVILLSVLVLIILSIAILVISNTTKKINNADEIANLTYTTTIGTTDYDIKNLVQENVTPKLSAGMIPVKWDGTFWTITTFDDTTWYNYANGQPAYMMLNDGAYQSELIADMTGKKLAKDSVGTQIQEAELGSIYMWLPRYAYNGEGEILYIKQEYSVAGSWILPEFFIYETSKYDYSLAGIWIEYSPLSTTNDVTTKINNMSGEENKYGFIANTKAIAMTTTEQKALQKYADKLISNVDNNPIKDITNTTRTILKIINTNQIEPIKAKVEYNKETEKVTVEIIYSKYGINKVVNENGKELANINTNKYELTDLNDLTYAYEIIDNEGNIKEIRINDIYIIPDVETLSSFRDEVNAGNSFSGKTVIQTANIDMSSVCSAELDSWTPIGATGTDFAGTYNGNYNKINNLYINTGSYAKIGLFSQTTTSTIIQNLVIENPYIYNSYSTNNSYTGGISGDNIGKITNCASIGGTITGYSTGTTSGVWVGGLVGIGHQFGRIVNCFNTATISGSSSTRSREVRCSGVCGDINGSGFVSNCYNGGSVIGKGSTVRVGGVSGLICGDKVYYSTLTNCYNYGTLTITSGIKKYLGGIVGANGTSSTYSAGTITNCYCTTGTTYSYYYYSGGMKTSMTGRVDSEVLKGYATTLGDAFTEDTNNINNGYPILTWQTKIRE